MKLLADASLPGLAACFPAPVELTLYHDMDELLHALPGQDALLCRSTLKVNEALLSQASLSCVATASSGTDHVDADALNNRGIRLLDAKGSNASSVADYVLASLAWLEKNTAFRGKKAMVIGYGMVGSLLAQRLQALDFAVIAYDPLKQGFDSCALDEIADCDLICVHASLHDDFPHPSRHLLDARVLALLRPDAAVINASRGDIVDEPALLRLMPPIYYCTDVFAAEPNCSAGIIEFSTLCTPHIAGHSVEAKRDALRMVSEKLHAFYHLEAPIWPPGDEAAFVWDEAWQDAILALYNPVDETVALKMAADKREAFLRLRGMHDRHAFGMGFIP